MDHSKLVLLSVIATVASIVGAIYVTANLGAHSKWCMSIVQRQIWEVYVFLAILEVSLAVGLAAGYWGAAVGTFILSAVFLYVLFGFYESRYEKKEEDKQFMRAQRIGEDISYQIVRHPNPKSSKEDIGD